MTLKLSVILIAIALCLTACAGLAGEPRIVASLPAPTPVPTDAGVPLTMPDMARGAAIFAANCTACHGVSGAGDGELVQSGQVVNPGVFTDAATAFAQRPTDWFATITNGRLENLMPPWRGALTEEERWAVALYTYTLHYDRAQLERGRDVWVANCVECHGESGRGDGERAAELTRDVGDLTDFQRMIEQSDQTYQTIIREGAGENMPAYQGELSDADIQAVAHFTRTLALSNPQVIGQPVEGQAVQPPVATQEAGAVSTAEATADAPAAISIGGHVTNGTLNGDSGAGAEVTLFTFDASFQQTQTTTTLGADGRYAFEGVPYDPASVYIATVNYRDRVFASAVARGDSLVTDAADGALDLPITIYELTEDPAAIQITGMVSQVAVVGDSLEVAHVMTLTNTSDRAFSSSQTTEDGRNISVVIALPPGAIVAGLPDEQRFVVAAEEAALLDTIPVLPGAQHLVQVIYLIPYEDEAIIEQQMNYALEGEVRLLLRPDSVSVTSEQLQPIGTETLGGNTFRAFGGALTLNAGEVVRYDLRGAGIEVAARSGEPQVVSANNLPVIALAFLAFIAVLIAVSYLLYTRSKTQPATPTAPPQPPAATGGKDALIEALVGQIAQLDARHEAGDLPDDAYRRERDALKKRLANLMDTSS